MPEIPAPAPSPIHLPLFRALWLASVVSNIGTTMNDTAAIWTMATLTSSPLMISLMQTMSSLPLFLLALPAGALADLLDRRKLILAAQGGALLTAVGMAILALTGRLSSPLLLLATFQLGIATAFTTPAWQAMLPEIVGKPQLSAALALQGIGFNVARSCGPVVGGLLIATLGPAPVFALNALSFVAILAVMWNPAYAAAPRSVQQEQMLGAMAAALRYTSHAPAMQAVLVRAALHVFAAVAPIALLPVLIRQQGGSGSQFGALMGCYGAGAILTALFILPKLRARFSFDRVLTAASLCSATAAALLAFAPNRFAMGAILLLAGGGWISALNTLSVAAQSAFPNWVRARSSAIYLVATQGAFALGALAWGRLTTDFGSTPALVIAATWMLVCAALDRWLPISHVETLDLSPSGHWHSHNLANEPAPEDGPVLITIDYHIDPKQAQDFRHAMRALRETRLRDGAFRCTLFHDLDKPSHFRETFLVGSWAEHMRQHTRATIDDQRIEEAVIAFHKGAERPRVRHFLMTNLRD
jgi:MFS family permease